MGKTRVLSVRLPYTTIAYCYRLQEAAGRNVQGKPVGMILSDTVEALTEASRRMYKIEDMTDEAAIDYVARLAGFIPGFEGAVPLWKEERQLQRQQPAVKEKIRPNDAPAEQTKLSEQTSYVPETVVDQLQEVAPPIRENYREEFAAGFPTATDYIEQAAIEEEAKDEQALIKAVDVGSIKRVSPDTSSDKVPACPWEGKDQVNPGLLMDDVLYKEAEALDELMAVAVRVVYWNVPKEEWGSPMAARLIAKVYGDYQAWRKKYGPA
jgi:hypothetical protein